MGFNLAEYEPVENRLRMFWREHPNGRITTELVEHGDGFYIVKASVWRDVGFRTFDFGGQPDPTKGTWVPAPPEEPPSSTGLASETETQRGVNSTSALENCETSAIGRALANMGYAPKGKRPSREEMQKSQRPESGDGEALGSGERGGGIEPNVVAGSPASTPHLHQWTKTLPDGKQTRPGWVVCDECGTGERESKVTVLTAPITPDEERLDLK